jgi:hypothetical protein
MKSSYPCKKETSSSIKLRDEAKNKTLPDPLLPNRPNKRDKRDKLYKPKRTQKRSESLIQKDWTQGKAA